jgi:hypothetical protein
VVVVVVVVVVGVAGAAVHNASSIGTPAVPVDDDFVEGMNAAAKTAAPVDFPIHLWSRENHSLLVLLDVPTPPADAIATDDDDDDVSNGVGASPCRCPFSDSKGNTKQP